MCAKSGITDLSPAGVATMLTKMCLSSKCLGGKLTHLPTYSLLASPPPAYPLSLKCFKISGHKCCDSAERM